MPIHWSQEPNPVDCYHNANIGICETAIPYEYSYVVSSEPTLDMCHFYVKILTILRCILVCLEHELTNRILPSTLTGWCGQRYKRSQLPPPPLLDLPPSYTISRLQLPTLSKEDKRKGNRSIMPVIRTEIEIACPPSEVRKIVCSVLSPFPS